MSLIVTVCGRKFRSVARSPVLQEVSEEVRQHIQLPSAPRWMDRFAGISAPMKRACQQAVRYVTNGYTCIQLALMRAAISARPVVQCALGL